MDDSASTARKSGVRAGARSVEAIVGGLEGAGHGPALVRSLGWLDLTLLGIGVIVGAGVFVITGTAAAEFAGPAIVLSFFLAAAACGLCALCYAELAALMPSSGSAYTYAQASLGEVVAWVVGWNLVMEYVFAASYVSVGWSGYFVSLIYSIGLSIPEALVAAPLIVAHGRVGLSGGIVNLPAVVLTVTMMLVARRGIGLSARVNALIVALKIGVLLLFVVAGCFRVRASNWSPFLPPNTGVFGHFGWSGVLRGAAVVFVSYLGVDSLATAAQETTSPQRNMPIGILASLGVCAILFAAVAAVLTGLVPYSNLNVGNPLSSALRAGGLNWLAPVIDVAAVGGLASVMLVVLLAQPRVLLAMGRDGLLPSAFSRIHRKYHTPGFGTLVTGGSVAVIGGLLPVSILAQLVSLGTLSVFVVVCISVVVLRHTRPDLVRPFKTPFSPLIPALGALVCLYLLFGLPTASWMLYGCWTIIGGCLYLFFGRRSAQRLRRKANTLATSKL